MVVRWQKDGIVGLSASKETHLTELDVFGAQDAILGLLDRCFCLVELSLRESTSLEGRELEIREGIEEILGAELFIGLEEGVQVPADNDLVLGQVFLQA